MANVSTTYAARGAPEILLAEHVGGTAQAMELHHGARLLPLELSGREAKRDVVAGDLVVAAQRVALGSAHQGETMVKHRAGVHRERGNVADVAADRSLRLLIGRSRALEARAVDRR